MNSAADFIARIFAASFNSGSGWPCFEARIDSHGDLEMTLEGRGPGGWEAMKVTDADIDELIVAYGARSGCIPPEAALAGRGWHGEVKPAAEVHIYRDEDDHYVADICTADGTASARARHAWVAVKWAETWAEDRNTHLDVRLHCRVGKNEGG